MRKLTRGGVFNLLYHPVLSTAATSARIFKQDSTFTPSSFKEGKANVIMCDSVNANIGGSQRLKNIQA